MHGDFVTGRSGGSRETVVPSYRWLHVSECNEYIPLSLELFSVAPNVTTRKVLAAKPPCTIRTEPRSGLKGAELNADSAVKKNVGDSDVGGMGNRLFVQYDNRTQEHGLIAE